MKNKASSVYGAQPEYFIGAGSGVMLAGCSELTVGTTGIYRRTRIMLSRPTPSAWLHLATFGEN